MRPRVVVAPLFALTLAACSAEPTAPAAPPLLTALPRALSVAEATIIDANNAFAFKLLQEIATADSNVFLSPLSVSLALGMTMNGAAGTTLDGMKEALNFGPLSTAEINSGYRSLLELLRSLDSRTQLNIANSIWFDASFPARQSFIDATRDAFNAEIRAVSFGNPATVGQINGWVSDATRGKIPTIIDAINPQDVMFLINAIFFKGDWRHSFRASDTRPREFYAADGTQMVPMMSRTGAVALGTGPYHRIGELQYGNGAFAMTVLMPRGDVPLDVHALTDSLTVERWGQWTAGMSEHSDIEVLLPKLRLEYKRSLVDDLSALGMQEAFDPVDADFSGLFDSPQQTFISDVVHKTFVEVNEQGTTAAAATAVTVGVTSAPPSFQVDRPFIVVLRERLSGTILFVGKVVRIPGA
jgi:serine protease inhibitor